MDNNWTYMQLLPNVNLERIPHGIPSISSNSIRKYLPKSFTVQQDELAAAEQFLYLVDVENDVDGGLSAHGPCHVVRCSGWWGREWTGRAVNAIWDGHYMLSGCCCGIQAFEVDMTFV